MASSIIRDWQSCPEGREKYQLYLASREWAVLKEAVRKRSGGACERCHNAPGANVHHQTYERKYRERLEDLVHVCIPCHEFLSGKRDRDPILDGPVKLRGKKIESVYLAGKITGTTWRDEVVNGGWSFENHSAIDFDIEELSWETIRGCLSIPDGRCLDLTGPYWRALPLGGHGDIGYSDRPHAASLVREEHHGEVYRELPDIVDLAVEIINTIRGSDLIFAWIDSHDCFGTLTEIGVARAASAVVVVGCPHDFQASELWLSFVCADFVVRADSAGEAWNRLWLGEHFPPAFMLAGQISTELNAKSSEENASRYLESESGFEIEDGDA